MPEQTLTEFFEKFNCSSVTQGTTRIKCRSAWRILMKVLGESYPVASVSPAHIDAMQRYLRDEAVSRYGKGFSEHSVFSYTAAVGEVFRYAVDIGDAPVNPVRRCHRIKPTRRQVHVYGADEIGDLLDTVRGNPDKAIAAMKWPDAAGLLRWTAFFLAGLLGLRVGEIWNLRWDDIDLETGLIHVRSRLDRTGEFWRWTAKGKAERDVPMSDDLWAVLGRLRLVATWRYPFLKECACREKLPRIGRLSELQRKYPYNNFHRELRRIREATNARRVAAKVERINEGTFHTLRKNAATQLAEQGVPSHFCQEILGHATDRLTKEVYTYVDRRKCLAASRQAFNAARY